VETAPEPDRVEKYEPYFGLTEAPFSLAPDPRFMFASASFSSALDQLAHALDRREPLVVVTGEIGTGKTLLCRAVLQQFRRKTFLSVIHDPLLERDDLLKQLLEDFGVIEKDRTRLVKRSRHELVDALHGFLRSLGALQAHAVVIIDEAQHLKPEVLEEIRLLSNIDDERGTLLQIVLVGQTELEALLGRPELRQLHQRVSRRFWLKPLNPNEVQQYINHRLTLARAGKGLSRTPGAPELANALAEWSGTDPSVEFTPAALDAVSELSSGLPRLVNLLCDRSLEDACASRLRTIDAKLVRAAARSLGIGSVAEPESAPEPFWSLMRSEAPAADTPAESVTEAPPEKPAPDAVAEPAATSGVPTYWLLVSGLAAAAVVFIWLGVRSARTPAPEPPPTAVSPPAPATAVPRSDAASPAAKPPVPAAPAPPPAAAAQPSAASTPAPTAAASAAGERFDIVVASFRTDERATAVASEVTTIGLPMRRRVVDGWQQVVCGPFASRADADDAQQRLARGGLTGTQIVKIQR
jgi:general secretion pathway protein A